MENKRGQSVNDRLKEEIEYAERVDSIEQKSTLAVKALGAVDLAVEFGLITYKQWETHIDRIFAII